MSGAVGRAHLAQDRSRTAHDFGNAEPVADFDQLASRHDHFVPRCQLVQRQIHCRGVIVDRDAGRSGQPFQQTRHVNVALATPAALKIVLEVRVAEFRLEARQRRPAQIRVQNHARGVDDMTQRGLGEALQILAHAFFGVNAVIFSRADFGSEVGQRPAHLIH